MLETRQNASRTPRARRERRAEGGGLETRFDASRAPRTRRRRLRGREEDSRRVLTRPELLVLVERKGGSKEGGSRHDLTCLESFVLVVGPIRVNAPFPLVSAPFSPCPLSYSWALQPVRGLLGGEGKE